MSVVTVRAVLLRSYPYSETSRILRFLTPDHGVVSIMAKGVRQRSSRGAGTQEAFDDGDLTFHWRGDRDLHPLRDFQAERSRRTLARDFVRFAGASFIVELVLSHTLQDANPSLFTRVTSILDRICDAPADAVAGWIVSGGWGVLAEYGFTPQLDRCVRCGTSMPAEGIASFAAGEGGLVCPACAGAGAGPRVGPRARRHLVALVEGSPPAPLRGEAAHLGLVERYALHHLQAARPFRSLESLRPLMTTESEKKLDPGGAGTKD